MDAQEVVFVQKVVGLSELEYSLLISITGIGTVSRAIILSILSAKLSLRYMIVIGIFMTTIGYIIYAFSWSFSSVATGFIVLGFFNVFINAGMATFYQNNVPVKIMGRVTSMFELIQSALQVLFILGIGIAADVIPLRTTIVLSAFAMLVLTIIFTVAVFNLRRKGFYLEEEDLI